ncbi:MAG: hypothetical protein LBB11_02040 [Puniceicoccales bacterium]|nr:hypothetical protein [Puniceicoccales bacterium]
MALLYCIGFSEGKIYGNEPQNQNLELFNQEIDNQEIKSLKQRIEDIEKKFEEKTSILKKECNKILEVNDAINELLEKDSSTDEAGNCNWLIKNNDRSFSISDVGRIYTDGRIKLSSNIIIDEEKNIYFKGKRISAKKLFELLATLQPKPKQQQASHLDLIKEGKFVLKKVFRPELVQKDETIRKVIDSLKNSNNDNSGNDVEQLIALIRVKYLYPNSTFKSIWWEKNDEVIGIVDKPINEIAKHIKLTPEAIDEKFKERKDYDDSTYEKILQNLVEEIQKPNPKIAAKLSSLSSLPKEKKPEELTKEKKPEENSNLQDMLVSVFEQNANRLNSDEESKKDLEDESSW